MKVLSRDFTLKEKILILVLCLVLLAIGYYFLIDSPVRTSINTANAEAESLQTQLEVINARVAKLSRMAQEMEVMENDPDVKQMPSYNKLKEELSFLNDAVKDAESYTISIANVTRDDDQIRRDVTITMVVESYEKAMEMIDELNNSDIRALIGNVSFTSGDGNIKEGQLTATVVVTFYETMVGGVADEGLPAEKTNTVTE